MFVVVFNVLAVQTVYTLSLRNLCYRFKGNNTTLKYTIKYRKIFLPYQQKEQNSTNNLHKTTIGVYS